MQLKWAHAIVHLIIAVVIVMKHTKLALLHAPTKQRVHDILWAKLGMHSHSHSHTYKATFAKVFKLIICAIYRNYFATFLAVNTLLFRCCCSFGLLLPLSSSPSPSLLLLLLLVTAYHRLLFAVVCWLSSVLPVPEI